MSFKRFITEQESFDIEKFKKDCAPFLNNLSGTHGEVLLLHGTAKPPKDWEIRQWRERTGPTDTPRAAHDVFNEYFKDRFGAPIRNWLFATGDIKTARVYTKRAPVCVIFPIGNYEFVSSPDKDMNDLTTLHSRTKAEFFVLTPYDDSGPATDKKVANYMIGRMRHVKWNTTDIVSAVESKNEIMLKCDKFYCLNEHGDTFNSSEFKLMLDKL